MSYKNFIPEVWAETIERDLERNHVFVADTNRQYEGKVEKLGDSVRILGVGKPSITTNTKAGFKGLQDPEEIGDTSVTMIIDKIAYFNYKVDDIDKRQAVGGLMEALSAETSEGLADEEDRAVSELAKDPMAVRLYKTAKAVTKDNILDVLDEGYQKLLENDVKPSTKVTVTLDPALWTIFKQAYIAKDTDNSAMLENGKAAKYGGMTIKISNNVAKDGTTKLVQMKTDRAIAYARPMTHTEPYRPEKSFSDAVKGFILYGAKIVRPKEMFVLNLTV